MTVSTPNGSASDRHGAAPRGGGRDSAPAHKSRAPARHEAHARATSLRLAGGFGSRPFSRGDE